MTARRLRSCLFAPANRADLVAKTARFAPDAVIVDLEDGTPPAEKLGARVTSAHAVRELRPRFTGSLWLRTNGPRDGLAAGDIASLADAPYDGVVVPKVEHEEDVRLIEDTLDQVAGAPMAVVWGFETVTGVHRSTELLAASRYAVAAYFGAEDYVVDLGGRRTAASLETLYPRSRVAMACRLRGVVAIDQAVVDLHDDERFRADATAGAALGYRGKICIHPDQVALCAEVYRPTDAEIDRARCLLARYDEAVADGRGTTAFDGQMIDTPMIRQARDTLARAEG